MYASTWEAYADRGWFPIPLPRAAKFPPPAGVTGWANEPPSRRQMLIWAESQPGANVGVRLPNGVIALDIDVYHGGGETYQKLLDRLGDLPATPWSSSGRSLEDPEDYSGHYYYSVPRGTRLVGAPGEGIDVVQYGHRYSVVAPSVHPDGRRYVWHTEDDEVTKEIPYADDFPRLPDSWLRALADSVSHTGKGFDGTVDEWVDSLPETKFSMMSVRQYNNHVSHLEMVEGGRHDVMVKTVNWLVHCGAEGQNVREPLDDLLCMYVTALDGERDGEREFFAALSWAITNFGSR